MAVLNMDRGVDDTKDGGEGRRRREEGVREKGKRKRERETL